MCVLHSFQECMLLGDTMFWLLEYFTTSTPRYSTCSYYNNIVLQSNHSRPPTGYFQIPSINFHCIHCIHLLRIIIPVIDMVLNVPIHLDVYILV